MQDRIDLCAEKFMELFGAKPTTNEGNDAEFMRLLQRFIFGEVCYTGCLDNKERELITITCLAVNQTYPQLKAHTNACLKVGCTPVEIRETIYQCAPFIGFPKTLNAIATMNEVFTANQISLPIPEQITIKDEDRFQVGLKMRKDLCGEVDEKEFDWLPKEFAEAIPRYCAEFVFGDYLSRSGLDLKFRELLVVVIITALGGGDSQLKLHINAALKAGNTKEAILTALLHAMPYIGLPRFMTALEIFKS
ncbi:4-carboxymuconolactone decarboxylase [Histomonas meleagridis]|uniref:4-carboxymuconolactone decarboxylase n=1 Tax=Histomonas meleagridis TaxID=135588 RepID=UPI00355AC246|nr:4-carboxymuconolactone decarboxylase [Histomonas meleagridis]KAH0800697.1 4-carboxymuconolactone decarboxylase [Histomonas meleagridis]